MRVSAWLRTVWTDPRLTWNATEWGIPKIWFGHTNYENLHVTIWTPDIMAWNGQGLFEQLLEPRLLGVYADGSWVTRVDEGGEGSRRTCTHTCSR